MARFEYTGTAVKLTQGSPLILSMPEVQPIDGLFFGGTSRSLRVAIALLASDSEVTLRFVNAQSQTEGQLSAGAHRDIVITLESGANRLVLLGIGSDVSNPYVWIPDNATEVADFANAVSDGDSLTVRLEYLEYVLEIDWNGDDLYDHALSNVTDDVVTVINTFRGRDYGSMIYGRSIAGSMAFELTNHHGRYERFNPASPLTGLVVPQRRIRLGIKGIRQQAHLILWAGRVDRFEPKERRGGADTTQVVAYGALAQLTQREVSISLQTMVSTGDAMEDILEGAGLPSEDIGDMDGVRMMARFWSRRQTAISAMREVEETEGGFVHETPTGSIIFEDSNFRVRGSRMQPTARFNDAKVIPAGEIPITYVRRDDPVKDIANIVQVDVKQFQVTMEAPLWSLQLPVQFNPDETRVFVVRYPNERTPGSVVALASFTEPTGADFVMNSASDGTGTALTASLTAEQNADGMVLTVTNGNVGGWLTTLVLRGTALQLTDPVTLQQIDQDSIDEFGPRTYPVPAQFISDVRDADTYAQFLISILKDPQAKIRMGFNINPYLDTALALDLSDRIALTTRETGGDMYVEAVEHHIDIRRKRHDMSLTLFPAIGYFSDVIVLDTGPGLDTGVLGR